MSITKAQVEHNAMIRLYSPLVRRVAHRMIVKLPPSVEIDDLIQVGMMGLSEAINRFDETQGAQFETFATQRIRGAMLDELRGIDWISRVSRRSQKEIDRMIHRLEQRLGRQPSDSEVAHAMDLSLPQYHALRAKVHSVQLVYLEDLGTSGDGADDFLDRHLGDAAADPMRLLGDRRKRSALAAAIQILPKREQYVMSLYYEHDMKLKEIAAVLGVTESRICQLHGQSIARLRHTLQAH